MYGLNDEEIVTIREGDIETFAAIEATLLRRADAWAVRRRTSVANYTRNCGGIFPKSN